MLNQLVKDVVRFWRKHTVTGSPRRMAFDTIVLREGRLCVLTEVVGSGYDVELSMYLCDRGWHAECEGAAVVLYEAPEVAA